LLLLRRFALGTHHIDIIEHFPVNKIGVILGWRWPLLPGLVAEAIPGVAAFPVWVLVVAAVAFWGEITRTAPPPDRR